MWWLWLFLVVNGEKLRFKNEIRPNVIFILADDYGFNDIGYHGSEIKTPKMDKLSSDGIRLTNYYVQPICTPSRSQLMSGKYQIHTGLQHQLIWRGMPSGLPDDTELLPEALRNCGYRTCGVGKWHLGYSKSSQTPWGRGFEKFTGYLGGSEDYYTKTSCESANSAHHRTRDCGVDYTTEDKKGNRIYSNGTWGDYSAFGYVKKAKEYLSTVKSKDENFFLYLPFQSVHMPLQAPESYIEPYRNISASKPREKYSGMVSVLDEAVGNLTFYLKENEMWEETIIIFSNDNGGQAYAGGNNLPYRGNKGSYWEGGIKGIGFLAGGFIERIKAQNKGGSDNYENLIHISDWYPTILEATGCSKDEKTVLDGYSHWKTLFHKNDDIYHPRQEILHNIDPLSDTDGTETRKFKSDYDLKKQSAIRWRNYKLLTGDPGYPDYPIPIPPNETLLEHIDLESEPELKLSSIPVRPIPLTSLLRLYDLESDPTEQNDISNSNLEIVEFMLAQLVAFNQTQVPVNFPPMDLLSFAHLHGGFYKPWFG